MSTPAETLKEIHRLRRYAKDLQTKLDDLPRRLNALKERVAYQENELSQAKETINHLKIKAKEDEVTLRATSEQIEKYTRQLGDILSKKEFDALNHEIAHAKERVDKLEDDILQTYSEIDSRTGQLPEFEKNAEKARRELADYEGAFEGRKAEFSAELEKTLGEIRAVEAALPEGELREQYTRLIRRREDDAFSPVKNHSCQACNTVVTPQTRNELLQGKFVLCSACGRIIYSME